MTDASWSVGKGTQFRVPVCLISNAFDLWTLREDSLQCDTEIERQVGLHIVVRQAATSGSQRKLIYFPCRWASYIKSSRATTCASHGPDSVPGELRVAGFSSRTANTMRVGRHFGLQQCNGFTTTDIAVIVQR